MPSSGETKKSGQDCIMEFLDNGATCHTSLHSKRTFKIVLKINLHHTTYTRGFASYFLLSFSPEEVPLLTSDVVEDKIIYCHKCATSHKIRCNDIKLLHSFHAAVLSLLSSGILYSLLQRVTIPDAVIIQFVLLKMGMLMLETCRGF